MYNYSATYIKLYDSFPYLPVSILCFSYGSAVFISGGYFAYKAVVHLRQPFSQGPKVVLDLLLLLLVLQDLPLEIFSSAAQILKT